MNRIQGSGSPNLPKPVVSPKPSDSQPAPKKRPKRNTDTIDLSDSARKLAEQAKSEKKDTSSKRVALARMRLEAGELFNPEALRKAAEHLLKSGDLVAGDDA